MEQKAVLEAIVKALDSKRAEDIQVIGVSCRERSRAKGRGQRHALHKTSRKSGLHGQNYDIRDGIKKSALL